MQLGTSGLRLHRSHWGCIPWCQLPFLSIFSLISIIGKVLAFRYFNIKLRNYMVLRSCIFRALSLFNCKSQGKLGVGTGFQNMVSWFTACQRADTVSTLVENIKAIMVRNSFYHWILALFCSMYIFIQIQ